MNGATSYAESAFGRAGEGGERVLPENFPVGMRVLLVDDDVTCLTVVKSMLLKCKYDVTTCSQATKALSLLRENKNAFDIILSDVHMPDMDGFRLLELVGLEMDLPVIMMSADTRFNIVMKGIKHGACDFLIKPVRMAELQNLWQHLVRRKWHDNREPEHSGSLDESDHGKQIDDTEYGSTANDGSDGSWRSQKKKREIKEEEDGELESTDPSSSKKPRVVWSVELHQKFVNAVNQLGIDKAVPKRILELMNVPGLTRENVASHLQKFRLYLKRLSGVVQHHTGLANSLSGVSSNAKPDHLGSLDFQTLAVTGQIPPQTLAVLQDELLGRPHSLSMAANAIDQTILRQTSIQGNKSVNVEQGISFGHPLLNGKGATFPMWSSNNLGSMVSPSNIGSNNTSQDANMLATMLQQQQSHPVLESNRGVSAQPSCLLSPAQSSQSFHVQNGPAFSNQVFVSPSQRSNNFYVENSVIPMNQNSVLLSSQSSTNLQTGNNAVILNNNSVMVPSQPLPNMSGGNSPGFLHPSTPIVPSQPLTNFQTGINQLLIGSNSMIPPHQSSSPFHTKHSLDPVRHNPSLNDSSSIVDYDKLSSEFNISGQVLDEDFSNSVSVNSYSNLGSISSIDGSSNRQLQSADGKFGDPNASLYAVPNSLNSQTGNIFAEDLSDQNEGRSLGFVGKGTHLPSRFVVDDMGEAPYNVFTHGNMYIGDDEYLLNQDLFGSSGSLQNGSCASTSFK